MHGYFIKKIIAVPETMGRGLLNESAGDAGQAETVIRLLIPVAFPSRLSAWPWITPDCRRTSGFSSPVCAAAFLRSSFSSPNPADAFRIENLALPTCCPFSSVLDDVKSGEVYPKLRRHDGPYHFGTFFIISSMLNFPPPGMPGISGVVMSPGFWPALQAPSHFASSVERVSFVPLIGGL